MKGIHLFWIIVLVVNNLNVFSQNYFTPAFENNAPAYMNFYIIEVKVNGTNLSEGDEIGIFDGETCVGAGKLFGSLEEWNDSIIISVKAGSNDVDTPEKDGFNHGANISFKLWSSEWEERIEAVTPIFYNSANGEPLAGEPVFEEGGTAFVSLHATHNFAPIAIAGENMELDEDSWHELDGSASYDPNGQPLFFFWHDLDNIGLTDTTLSNPTFKTPQVSDDTWFRIALKVSDGEKYSKPDTIRIKVKLINHAPVADAGEYKEVQEGETVYMDGTGSYDPDNAPDELSFNWEATNDLQLSNDSTSTPWFTAPFLLKDSTFSFVLRVFDGNKYSDTDTVWVTIMHSNLPPVANAGVNQTVNEGEVVYLDGTGSYDPEGDSLNYFWFSENLIIENPLSATTTFTAPQVEKNENISVILKVNDGKLDSEPDTLWITVKQVNKKPQWAGLPADTLFAGYSYLSYIEVTDEDSLDTITIFTDDLPEWLYFEDLGNGTAKLFTDSVPRRESLMGTWPVTLYATDGTEMIDTLLALRITIQTGLKLSSLSEPKVYPNPTNETIFIELEKTPATATRIVISNLKGQAIHTSWLTEQKSNIRLWGNPSGFYLVTIFANGSENSQLIILK
jgi:hypothetical protein